MIYAKGEPTVFSPCAGRTTQRQFDKRSFRGPNRGKASSHPLGAHPGDVWSDCRHVGANHREKVDHSCQMSEQLARKIIELYTNAGTGTLVVDPFSGSGTTQKVCIENMRSFIGADLYFEDIRNARLAGATPETYRPFPGVTPESAAFWANELAGNAVGHEPWRALVRQIEIPAPTLFDLA